MAAKHSYLGFYTEAQKIESGWHHMVYHQSFMFLSDKNPRLMVAAAEILIEAEAAKIYQKFGHLQTHLGSA